MYFSTHVELASGQRKFYEFLFSIAIESIVNEGVPVFTTYRHSLCQIVSYFRIKQEALMALSAW